MGARQSVTNCFSTARTQQAHPELSINTPRKSKQAASPTTPNRSIQIPLSSTPSTPTKYTVFISHAGEDKATIPIPLRDMLTKHGITAFVDETDMPPGTPAANAMISAMECAEIAVITLSPEFIARKWPMKELMCFLRRREQTSEDSKYSPVTIIPFFYRLAVSELYGEPRLDRVDSKGNSLYLQSRFLERMNAGEPEANIEEIKAALREVHGIMGIRNDLDASNDSAYFMYRRRQILLQELCDKIRRTVHTVTVNRATNIADDISHQGGDKFHAYFAPTPDISHLVFEFGESSNGDLNANTQDANILRKVLDESQVVNRVIAIYGIGGAGKTSILRGISSLMRVKEQFKDGIYDISLGMDATKGTLIEELSKTVEHSGGIEEAKKMRREEEVGKVILSFRSWFAMKKCLFMIDDVWQNREITSSVIHELMRLHVSGDGSKVLLATRSIDVASRANAGVKLERRDTLGLESRRMLWHYAEIEPEDEEEEAFKEILERCSGLPLFLAVAGKAVKVLSLRPGHEGCTAYRAYAQDLKANVRSMLTMNVDVYERLDSRLMISIDVLEERKAKLGFSVSRRIAEIHRRLSVMKKQSKVPMRMLKFLWELESETQAVIIAAEFERAGLAEVEYERSGSDRVAVLRLHDSLYEFAVSETSKYEEESLGHEMILSGYGQCLPVKDGTAEWWNLEDDGYILVNICRHLFAAGRCSELVRLLLSPQWTERQLKVNGILNLEADFALAIDSVRSGIPPMVDETDSAACEAGKALQLILEAAVLSWSFVSTNFKELGFQMHGRLKRYGERMRWIREYVDLIEANERGPSVLCANSFLGEPGGANVSIISTGHPIHCIAVMKGSDRVACGCEGGGIAIVNTVRNEVEKEWTAHDRLVKSIAVTRNNTRLVSASSDSTVKVWNIESGRCVTTFRGHTNWVSDVEVMKDEKRVVSASSDGSAQIWGMDTGYVAPPPFTSHGTPVNCVAVLEGGKHVITGGKDHKLRMWNSRTGRQVGVSFQGHKNSVKCITITPDGRRVASASADCTVRVWDIESHSQIGESLTGHTDWVTSVAFSGDGSRIVSGSQDSTIRVWDCESGNEICPPLIGHGSAVEAVSFAERDDFIVSCSRDTTIRLRDLRRQKADRIRNHHAANILSVLFTLGGKFVVSASRDGTLRIWDSTSGDQVGDPLKAHSEDVIDVAVTPNGRFIVSVSVDGTLCVWDLRTRRLLHTFTGHTGPISCVAVKPQGDRAVTGSGDKIVRVWNLRTNGGSPVVFRGHSATVRRVFVTDDGLRIVSVAFDYFIAKLEDEIFVWNIQTRQVVHRFTKRYAWKISRREVFDLVGERTVDDDTTLSIPLEGHSIWYGEGREKQVLATLEADIQSWALSPDRKTVCVGFRNGLVGLMKLKQ